MPDSSEMEHGPSCLLAHEFVNKLTIIIGNCDLLIEREAEAEIPDSHSMRRLQVIRDAASRLAGDIQQHTCEISKLARETLMHAKDYAVDVRDANSLLLVSACNGERDPLETNGERNESSIGRRGVAVPHLAQSVGNGAVRKS